MLHLPDWSLIDLPTFELKRQREFGIKSALYLPLLHDGVCIGLLTLVAKRSHSFGPAEIAQAESFRDQALIAIDNTRLLNELRERTDDLSESLEQQTATSEVLRVISSSPGELEPVFQAMLENAIRLCEAKFGILFRFDGEGFRLVADVGARELGDFLRQRGSFQPTPGGPLSRVMQTKQPSYTNDHVVDAPSSPAVTLGGARSTVDVPMLKDGQLVGAISIYRQEVRPFSEEQRELLTNFANQAVIAIENARLLNELRELLEQQTATADVLRVISSSPGELEPVFQAMLENATRICGANFGNMFLYEHDAYRTVPMHNAPQAYANARTRTPLHPSPATALGRVAVSKEVVQIADLKAEKAYIDRDPMYVSGVELAGIRTLLAVPMLKDGGLIGAIVIYRTEVRPFTDKQIALVRNFAAQAVIAIENTRLLSELRQRTNDLTESLEQQTATSEVLSVISSSPGDLQPVFAAMLKNAARICDAKFGNIYRWEGDALHLVGTHNTPPAFAEARRGAPFRPDRNGPFGRVLETKTAAHIADLVAEESYAEQRHPGIVGAVELGGVRTILLVPML